MKKLLPWLVGMLIGMILTGLVGIVLIIGGIFIGREKVMKGNREIIAVSWGWDRSSPDFPDYQARVSASDLNEDGTLEISLSIYPVSRSGFYEMGVIGVAADRSDAVKRFSRISWTPGAVEIGGEAGVMATITKKRMFGNR